MPDDAQSCQGKLDIQILREKCNNFVDVET